MKHLRILVPLPGDLLAPDRLTLAAPPFLARMLRAAAREPAESSLAAALCDAFGIERGNDWPWAAISARGDGLARHAPADTYWLRIDPLHLEIGMGGLIAHDPATLDLSQHDAGSLARQIEDAVPAWRIHCPNPTRWYLGLTRAPDLTTVELDRLSGAYLGAHLPTGTDAPAFLRAINDAQMALHAHPLNDAREAAGLPTVNGLWLWGGGRAPTPRTDFNLVAGGSAALTALADLAGIERASCPAGLADVGVWRRTRRALVVLDPVDPGLPADEWLARLDSQWLGPALTRLRLGLIGRLDLHLLSRPGLRLTLTPLGAWKP